jgi:hypothetical protein
MAYYRLYLLDARGGITAVHEAELVDDEAAVAAAAELDHPHGISIWQQARHVAELTSEQRDAGQATRGRPI